MGKKGTSAAKQVDRNKKYRLSEAIELAKKAKFAKFDETFELAVRLGVNPAKADQNVRGTVVLPRGTGKKMRVLVIAKGEKAAEARDAGADEVGADEIVAKIQGGWLEFDVVVATPDMMGVVGRLGKVLGPRGLMPNPKTGTVTADVKKAITEIRSGKVDYRVEKAGIVHAPFGKSAFSADDLVVNARALLDSIVKAKPSSAKGVYIRSITVSTTMGPGVKVDLAEAMEPAAV